MTEPDHTAPHSHPPLFRFAFTARLVLLATGLLSNILILSRIVDIVPGVAVFTASVVLYILITAVFWKCPHCRRYPGNAVMPDYCEKCGEVIFGVDARLPDLKSKDVALNIPMRYLLLGRLLYGLALLAYFVVFAPQQGSQPTLFWSGALFFIAAGGWLEWRWWRCPQCGGYMKRSLWPGRSCSKCGTPFRF